MKLMRPYPDEMVGSILSRACRQFGLKPTPLLIALTGRRLIRHSLVVTNHANIAEACGMSLEEFHLRHTIAMYAIAFVPEPYRNRLWQSALSGNGRSNFAGMFGQGVSKWEVNLQYCPNCAVEDQRSFGESYWRRLHQIPGVTVCIQHRRALVKSATSIVASVPVPMPHRCGESRECVVPLSEQLQVSIAEWSEAAAAGFPGMNRSWMDWYRERAAACGYDPAHQALFSGSIASDLARFYGLDTLAALKCNVGPKTTNSWAARLMRPHTVTASSLKHILLAMFLDSWPLPSSGAAAFRDIKKGAPINSSR